MKITPLRLMALATAVVASSFVFPTTVSALDVGISVGAPPPPLVEHRWPRPYRNAVWISGHHEWINGAWVWVGGYYAYPPYPGAHWISGHYRHGYYVAGHWSNR